MRRQFHIERIDVMILKDFYVFSPFNTKNLFLECRQYVCVYVCLDRRLAGVSAIRRIFFTFDT
jgi:hypothetical protein